jgi:NAD(P)-dependent dehydrogenase (short-subunit alcohol dehydrogenase family)
MVKLSAITETNARFASGKSNNESLVCVFVGATSGTGSGTIEKLATMLEAPTFYVLGRSAARFAGQRAKLERLNSNLKLEFIETDVTLISGIDAACENIMAAEKRVDYLYMSQGCIPLSVPQCMLCPRRSSKCCANELYRHERRARHMFCTFILLQNSSHNESAAIDPSITTAASSERAQWRQRETHARRRHWSREPR